MSKGWSESMGVFETEKVAGMKTIDEVDDRERVEAMVGYYDVVGYDRCPWCDQDVPVHRQHKVEQRVEHSTSYSVFVVPEDALENMRKHGLTPQARVVHGSGNTCAGTHTRPDETPPVLSERGKRLQALIAEHVGWMTTDYDGSGFLYGIEDAAEAIDRELS